MAVTLCEIGWLNVSVGLCVFCSSVFFCEKKNNCETRWGVLSLTELTEFTEHFCAQFRVHRRPPAYRIHRALLPKMAVRFCEIGWLNVSVEYCVFCSSVFFCEKKNIFETRWGVLSLTERTEFTEHFCALFRAHRTPPAYRIHRTLLPKMAVRFCEIGWLNVSVGLCVFCSSVFFCEKENAPSVRKRTLEIRWGVPSLTKDIFFSHRAHRVHGGFWRTFRAHRTPSAYRVHRALLPKMAVRFCEIGWLNVSVDLCVFC